MSRAWDVVEKCTGNVTKIKSLNAINNEVIKRISECNHAGNSAKVEMTNVVNVMNKAKSTQKISSYKLLLMPSPGFQKWQLVGFLLCKLSKKVSVMQDVKLIDPC